MEVLKQMNYLLDKKLKIKLAGMLLIILAGAIAELVGVTIILPIVDLAMNPAAVADNKWCVIITNLTGLKDSSSVLLVLIAVTVSVYVVKNIYLSWMAHRMNCFSKNLKQHFSVKLMEAYMKQPYAYFLNKNTSEILRSVNSDTVNFYAVVANSLQMISQGITTLLIVAFLAMTNLTMTILVAVLLGSCAAIVVFGLQKPMRRMGREFQRLSAFTIQYAKQAFEGIKEVKISNKEKYFIDEYKHVFDRASEIERISNLLSFIPKYLIETVCIAGILGYLAYVIISGGSLTDIVPQLATFSVAAFKLLPSINVLYSGISNIIYHKASIDVIYNDIKEVENIKTDFSEDCNVGDFIEFRDKIQVKGITFAYENTDKNVLENINFTIEKGQSIAFVGESGGGKTTMVDIVLGLLKPTSGQVLADGKDIQNNIRGWHERIGYIPQLIYLLDDSIRKNVAFGVREEQIDNQRVWKALQEAKLEEFVRGLEQGLDTEVGEAGTRLSGGQRQRIGIARALYHDPDILVFDEATSALDTETEKEVMEAIDGLQGLKTMIMIAHRLSTIENCEHVYRVGGQSVEQVR